MLTRAYVASREDFPDDVSILGRYSEHDPNGGPDNWVVLWDGDRPVSALRLFYRVIEAGTGGHVRMAGIGNVGTDPEFGGRGLGHAVMNAAHERLAAERVPVALLVTDIPEFYARVDYSVVPQAEIVATVTDVSDGQPAGRRLKRSEPTPPWVHRLHGRIARRTGGRVCRPAEYWDRWIDGFRALPPVERWVLSDRAYLFGRPEESGEAFRVLEGGGDPDTLRSLVERARGGARRVKAPDDEPCRTAVASLASDLETRTRGGIMSRPIDESGPAADSFAGYLELDTF